MSATHTGAAAKPFVSHPIRLTLNRRDIQLDVLPWTTLLDLLREQLDLTGTKKGCDHGQCGACTVLLNGKRVNACLTLAVMCDGAELTTIEGLASGKTCTRCSRRLSNTTPSSAAIARRGRFARRWAWPGKAVPTTPRKSRN